MISKTRTYKKRKAISPLISVILLIAFTMVVAGILAAWATQFVKVRQSEFIKCSDAAILIQSSYYDTANNTLYANIFNNGKIDVSGLYYIITLENGSVISASSNATIHAGSVLSFNLSTPSNIRELSVRSKQCQGTQDSIGKYYIQGIGY